MLVNMKTILDVAKALSTSVCLMKMAELQQYAPPLTLYGAPVNKFVAGQQVGITVKGNNICFFDPETEQLEAIGALTLQK